MKIRRGAEAIPEALRGVARRFGHFLPLGVQLAQRTGRGRQIRLLALLLVALERRDDGLGHRDELFLALGVGEAAPVVHLAQFADARRDLLLKLAQPRDRLVDFVRPGGLGRLFEGRGRCRAAAVRLRAG